MADIKKLFTDEILLVVYKTGMLICVLIGTASAGILTLFSALLIVTSFSFGGFHTTTEQIHPSVVILVLLVAALAAWIFHSVLDGLYESRITNQHHGNQPFCINHTQDRPLKNFLRSTKKHSY